jgi:hypothetical protein
MACSKIFSGDLPELTSEIMQYFQNDFSTLHSCIFVNRFWCRLAIPLLWENPFSIDPNNKNCSLIEMYLHKLNEDDKEKLNEYGINNDIFPSNILFNYPSFIKCFNMNKVYLFISEWAKNAIFSSIIEQPGNLSTKVSNLVYNLNQSSSFIFMSLIKIFIENKVNLNTFEIEAIDTTKEVMEIDYFRIAFQLILQNPNFICNVKNLKIHSNGLISKLSFLECFNSISSIYIHYYSVDECDYKDLPKIINSQQNLKKIYFGYSNYPLKSLKNSNCLNTLKTIIFHGVNLNNLVTDFNEVFEQLNVLDSIHILYCYPIDSSIIKQIINLTKPFKLKSLFMNENSLSRSDQLKLLLQKSGDYLENIRLEGSIINNIKLQLFELVQIYCINIKYIDLYEFDDQNIHSVFDLIKNKQQNLNYLSINFYGFNYYHELSYDDKLSSFILHNLGQILPYRLEYLSLVLRFDINDLEIFFSNSQTIFIRKLLISSKSYQNILPCIKKYVMKEKMVAYLAIEYLLPHNGEIKDLFYSKDEVDEFKFYDIQVTSHNDLCSKIHDFINEL